MICNDLNTNAVECNDNIGNVIFPGHIHNVVWTMKKNLNYQNK